MTVHQSKGKEFAVVFVIDVAEGRFPLDYQKKEFYVPRELSRGLSVDDDERSLYEQEERRLLYVAMTRAEHKLYLTYAEQYSTLKGKKAPSKFLVELNADLNPLIEMVKEGSITTQRNIVSDNPLERVKRELQNQAATAAHQMLLKAAFQNLVHLEQIRRVQEDGSLEQFSVENLIQDVDVNGDWLEELLRGVRTPLRT